MIIHNNPGLTCVYSKKFHSLLLPSITHYYLAQPTTTYYNLLLPSTSHYNLLQPTALSTIYYITNIITIKSLPSQQQESKLKLELNTNKFIMKTIFCLRGLSGLSKDLKCQ